VSRNCPTDGRLSLSVDMATLLERANAFDLAEFVYRRMGAHEQVASCLLRKGVPRDVTCPSRRVLRCFLGSSKQCVDYLLSASDSIVSMKELLVTLFHRHPSVNFAVDIVTHASNRYVQVDELVLLFLELDQHAEAVEFVERLMNDRAARCHTEDAVKLKLSYDLLKKYSYLADEQVKSLTGASRCRMHVAVVLDLSDGRTRCS
jgi:hypothetical protein